MNIIYHYDKVSKESSTDTFEPSYDIITVDFMDDSLSRDVKLAKRIATFQNDIRALLFKADNVMFAKNYQDITKYYVESPTPILSDYFYHLEDIIIWLNSFLSVRYGVYIVHRLILVVEYNKGHLMFRFLFKREFAKEDELNFDNAIRKHLIDRFLSDTQ